MRQSTIQWHLARDNQTKLAKFCLSNKLRSSMELHTHNDGEHDYFQMTFIFNNGGFIIAEMLHGDTKSYSTTDHFQVVDYSLGA